MATDQDVDPATQDATLEDNETVADPETSTKDGQKPDPADEAKQRYAALREGYSDLVKDNKTLRAKLEDLEKFQKKFRFEEDDKEVTEEEKIVTREDLEILRFETLNSDKIAIVHDEYEKYRSEGVKPNLALKLSLFDKGITDDQKLAEHIRQAEVSSPPSVVDRSGDDSAWSEADKARAKLFKYDLKTRDKYRAHIEGRKG